MTRVPLRFCALVLWPAAGVLLVSAALLAAATALAMTDPDSYAQVYGLALLVQMFAASTGYRLTAQRGYFDAVLAGRRARAPFACAHLIVSLAPGGVLWLLLAAIDRAVHPAQVPAGLTVSGLTAVALVSVVAWTLSLPITQYAAGAAWTATLLLLAASHRLIALREAFVVSTPGVVAAVGRAAGGAAFPVLLVAYPHALGSIEFALLFATIGIAVSVGVYAISRLDVPLVESR